MQRLRDASLLPANSFSTLLSPGQIWHVEAVHKMSERIKPITDYWQVYPTLTVGWREYL